MSSSGLFAFCGGEGRGRIWKIRCLIVKRRRMYTKIVWPQNSNFLPRLTYRQCTSRNRSLCCIKCLNLTPVYFRAQFTDAVAKLKKNRFGMRRSREGYPGLSFNYCVTFYSENNIGVSEQGMNTAPVSVKFCTMRYFSEVMKHVTIRAVQRGRRHIDFGHYGLKISIILQ